jgi:hypothetical protein
VDIGDNLLRPATYSDLFATSDTYVVSSDGVFLSPSHYEQELKAAGRLRTRSMLELKLQTPQRDELTSAFQQSRELFESQASRPSVDLLGYEGVRGRKEVGAWSRVEGTDWVCIAEIDHAEAFARLV